MEVDNSHSPNLLSDAASVVNFTRPWRAFPTRTAPIEVRFFYHQELPRRFFQRVTKSNPTSVRNTSFLLRLPWRAGCDSTGRQQFLRGGVYEQKCDFGDSRRWSVRRSDY